MPLWFPCDGFYSYFPLKNTRRLNILSKAEAYFNFLFRDTVFLIFVSFLFLYFSMSYKNGLEGYLKNINILEQDDCLF